MEPAPNQRADAKQRVLDVLNQRYRTTLTVEMIEAAVGHGLTSWESLRQEASEPAHQTPPRPRRGA